MLAYIYILHYEIYLISNQYQCYIRVNSACYNVSTYFSFFMMFYLVEHVKKREQARANKEHGDRIKSGGGLIGGSFELNKQASYQQERITVFDRLWAKNQQELSQRDDIAIAISLPDGNIKQGVAFKTSPYDIALSISKGLADSIVIAKIIYTSRYEHDLIIACDEDEESLSAVAENKPTSSIISSGDGSSNSEAKSELWDLHRPLIGDCSMQLLKFDDPEAKTVFWHSSAHVLGR